MFTRFRKTLAAALAASTLFATSALAVGPIQTDNVQPSKQQTYSAVATFTPAASATDFFTITGSATLVVAVRRIACTGTSTAAGSLIVTVVKRSALDTTGTATNPTAVPMDSANAAATAVVAAYTVNPGGLGAAVGTIAGSLLPTVAPASSGINGLTRNFFEVNDVKQAVILRGAAQNLALNAGGVSFTAGASLTCEVVWTESTAPL